MKKLMRGCAIAAFATMMTVAGGANAAPPDVACTAANEGEQLATPSPGGYTEWECSSGNWAMVVRYICTPGGGCIPL
ncbi:hypothetical protein ABE488_13785 [Luteimonas sp. TWI662]|uniref:hypothetical protein n=1 Tax=Luteimonas sp. TWI662 TaxID=3136789 RepID=UPI00320B29E2